MSTERPLVGVGVAVFKDGRVLLVRRAKPPRQGEWSLPGGRQRLWETVRECGVREIREECGIEIEVHGLVDVIDAMTPATSGDQTGFHYTLIELAAGWLSGEARAASDALELVWADPDDLEPYHLWAESERIIALAAVSLDGLARPKISVPTA